MKGRRLTPERFNAAIEAARAPVLNFARSLTRSDADAQDLAQATLVRALSKRHAYRDSGKIEAWLCRIAHNLFVNEIRRDQRRGVTLPLGIMRNLSSGEDCEIDDDSRLQVPATQLAAIEHSDLERCLAVIPKDQVEVLLLIGAEGRSYGDVAVLLAVPIGTVRSRLSRGRLALKRMLDGQRPIRAGRRWRKRPRTTAVASEVEQRRSRGRRRAALIHQEA